MRNDQPSYTELTHRVVRESPQPLPFADILQRVHALSPITTKNPKNTIRGAITQSHLIVATGDGRYGWKPRLLTGSVLRHTLTDSDLQSGPRSGRRSDQQPGLRSVSLVGSQGRAIEIGDDLREALWPTFFEIAKRRDESPIHLRLPDGRQTQLPLDFFGQGHWGTTGSPEFWSWFETLDAKPGDHLIFRVLDGDARLYSVEFQPRSARDEAAIAERNRIIVQFALEYVRSRANPVAYWDVTSRLLVTGQYRHPVPPDPLSEIWTEEVWRAEALRRGDFGAWLLLDPRPHRVDDYDTLREEFFENLEQPYDYDPLAETGGYRNPVLPREYDPDQGQRRPRPSRKARLGVARTFTLRVNHRALCRVWREIEIAEDQTLEDLHLMIQRAFDWGDDHLYSFFMSGEASDRRTEIGSPWSETDRHTHQVQIGDLDLQPRQTFLYFFDYGDRHEFDVRVVAINPAAPNAQYPRIVRTQGEAPPQYPDYDEETGKMSWDPYRH